MSKKDKAEKTKVISLDQQAKTSSRDIRQVRQVPYWSTTSEFTLMGDEFLKLQNFINIFSEPMQAMNSIFKRHLDNGTISVKYLDNNNNEFTKEEVTNYITSQQAIAASLDKHVQEPVTNS